MAVLTKTRRLRNALLTAPLFALAVIWVPFDDLFRSVVVPMVARLAQLRPIQRLEGLISMLPPYPTLALFIIPLAIIEPFKIYGLYLIGTGHLWFGILAFIMAKVVGIGIAERLFSISRDKLLSIPWFASLYAKAIAIKDKVHAYLATTRAWPALMAALAEVKAFFIRSKSWFGQVSLRSRGWVGGLLQRGTPGPLARRFTAARRVATSFLHPNRVRTASAKAHQSEERAL